MKPNIKTICQIEFTQEYPGIESYVTDTDDPNGYIMIQKQGLASARLGNEPWFEVVTFGPLRLPRYQRRIHQTKGLPGEKMEVILARHLQDATDVQIIHQAVTKRRSNQ